MNKWWADSMECVQDLLADGEDSPRKTIRRTTQGTDHSMWCDGRTSSDFNTRSIETSPIWQESFARNISRIRMDRGWNLERRHSHSGYRGSGKDGPIRNLFTKSQCERSVEISTGRRIYILNSRWYTKMSGRDYEVQEPTQRREQTVGSEDLSRGLRRSGRPSTDRITR